MSEQTTQMAKSVLNQARPWRKGMPWWVVVIEGLMGLAFGLYILTQPAAGGQIIIILAIYLLVTSIERTILGFSERIPQVILAERMLRAGVGLTVGLIILLNAWQPFMDPPAPLVLLSVGFLLLGVIGIWEWITARSELGLGLGGLISPVAFTLFGLLMLGSRLTLGSVLVQWLGILVLVAGVALLGYGFMLFRSSRSAPVPDEGGF